MNTQDSPQRSKAFLPAKGLFFRSFWHSSKTALVLVLSAAIIGGSLFGGSVAQAQTAARVGQLVYNPGNRTIFLVGSGGLYGFPDAPTFFSWGFAFSQVVVENSTEQALTMVGIVPTKLSGCSTPLAQIAGTCTGGSLTLPTTSASGTRVGQLVYNPGNRTIFLVGNNGLFGFPDAPTFYSWGFTFSQVVAENSAEQSLTMAGIVPTKQTNCATPLAQIGGTCGTTPTTNGSTPNYQAGSTAGSGSCDQNLMSFWSQPGAPLNEDNVPSSIACGHIGQNWVGSFSYSSNGTCYHTDWTGNKQITCPSVMPPALSGNGVPNVYDSSFNWNGANAACYHTAGDLVMGIYGATRRVLCGSSYSSALPNASQILSSPATTPNQGSNSVISGLSLVQTDYISNPTAIDYLGTLVGAGTVSTLSASCDQTKIAQGYGAVYNSSQTANPPVDAACRTIGKGWIGSMDYSDASGICYHADWTGTYKIDCSVLQKITGAIPPTLPGGVLPTDIFNTSFNWLPYNTKCYYTAGDLPSMGASNYGIPAPATCGAFHGTNSLMPSASEILSSTSALNNPYSGGTNKLALIAQAYTSNPTALDYLGTKMGNGTVANFSAACDQTKINAGYGAVYNASQPANPTVDAACRTIGKDWVGALDYNLSGTCYHADWTGTYQIDCNILQKVTGNTPPTLSNGQIPTSIFDTSFNWVAANAVCYHTAGDLPSFGVNNYGIPAPVICGNTVAPNAPPANDPTNTPSLSAGRSGAWVGFLNYTGSDGKCYHYDWNGTGQVACNSAAPFPTVSNGSLPYVYDSSFNWKAANGKCYYTMNNPASENALYTGVASNTWEIICGAGR